MSREEAFFAQVAKVALGIHQREPRIYPETLMVQFAQETGFYGDGVWQGHPGHAGRNNLAGISPGGRIADYESLTDFEIAYVEVIRLPYYQHVLSAPSPVSQMYALGSSPWSATHYMLHGTPGGALVAIWDEWQATIEAALYPPHGAQHETQQEGDSANATAEPAQPSAPEVGESHDVAPSAREPKEPAEPAQQPAPAVEEAHEVAPPAGETQEPAKSEPAQRAVQSIADVPVAIRAEILGLVMWSFDLVGVELRFEESRGLVGKVYAADGSTHTLT